MLNHKSQVPLNSRLRAAASMVRRGARMADVGTDHAYLPIWLVQSNICPSAIASDIRPGPLEPGGFIPQCRRSGREKALKRYPQPLIIWAG